MSIFLSTTDRHTLVIRQYCTILISSARAVTCDHMDEISISANWVGTWDTPKISAAIFQTSAKFDILNIFKVFFFGTLCHSWPTLLGHGTSLEFRPWPIDLWPVTAELIKMVQYFHKRFSVNSTATKVTYRQELDRRSAATLSQALKVSVYDLNSLPPEEKLAVQCGK